MKTVATHLCKLFALVTFTLFISSAIAGIEIETCSIATVNDPIEVGTLLAQSEIFVPAPTAIQRDVHVGNKVQLEVNRMSSLFVQGTQNVTVEVRITPYNAQDIAQPIINTKLTIDYHHDNNYKSKILDEFEFSGAYRLHVELTQVWVDGVLVNILPANLRINSFIIINRYQVLNPNITGLVSSLVDPSNPSSIKISWHSTSGAEEYQLEYGHINNYGGPNQPSVEPSNLTYDFTHNSTRVSSRDTHYEIPLMFNQGYVYYRVRPVGVNINQVDHILYGDWTQPNSSGNLNFLNDKFEITGNLVRDPSINWQHAATFAEEGKRKDVITYYDGSMRNRQMVTRVSSDANIIVGETIYDHQGRPTVTVLPTPVLTDSNPTLKYYPQFNKNTNGQAYSKADFDTDDKIGNANPLDETSGAALYYSPLNPNQQEWQAYVPDAHGYPFQQVQYEPNGTGKIMVQSGVGADFKLGSGKETKYLYGNPNQLELNRLFGSEVGFAEHYKKNSVIDANGQVSISFLDLSDKVIATALAGRSPYNLNAIDSLNGQIMSVNYLDLVESSQEINHLTNSISYSTTFIVTDTTVATFDYSLKTVPFLENCLPNLCIDCVYELSYSLKDVYGTELLPNTTTGTLVGNFQFIDNNYYFHGNCIDTSSFTLNDTLLMASGSYSLSKTLKIHEPALQVYLDSIEKSACVRTLADFIADELANIDSTRCMVTCESCKEDLGSIEDFIGKGLGTASDYYSHLKECNDLCKEEVSLCENYEFLLRSDMMPGGQYGEYQDPITNEPRLYPLSVYNNDNVLPNSNASWRSPMLILANGEQMAMYVNGQGDRSKIYLTRTSVTPLLYSPAPINNAVVQVDELSGEFFIYPEQLDSLKDFINAFDFEWTKSLLIYHPEYCFYEQCVKYEQKATTTDYFSSASFDDFLRNTGTFADAVNNGLVVNNVPRNWAKVDPFYADSLRPWDPFSVRASFFNDGVCELDSSTLRKKVERYKFENGVWYSMKEIAAYTARCGGDFPATVPASCLAFGTGTDTTILNNEWNIYKSLYISTKSIIQEKLQSCRSLYRCNSTNACIGSENYNVSHYLINFLESGTSFHENFFNFIIDPSQPCSYINYLFYRNKQKRFVGMNDLENMFDVEQVSYDVYTQTGLCPTAFALQNLLGEMFEDSTLFNTNANLNLNQYSHLSSLFQASANNNNPGPIPQLNAVHTLSGNSLNSVWKNGVNTFATLTLHKPSEYEWSDFYLVSNLEALSQSNFTIDAIADVPTYYSYWDQSLQDSVIYDTVITQVVIELQGTISSNRFNLENCSFLNECVSNQLLSDIGTLLNIFSANNTLFTNIPKNLVGYVAGNNVAMDLNTLYLQNAAGVGANLQFVYDDSSRFKIYNAQWNLNDGLYVHFDFDHLSTSILDSIVGFGPMLSTGQFSFSVEAFILGGGSLILDGYLFNKSGSQKVGLLTGNCSPPTPSTCKGVEYKMFEDFKNLLTEAIINFDGTSINLYGSLLITPNLVESFSSINQNTTSVKTQDTLSILSGNCSINLILNDGQVGGGTFESINNISNFHLIDSLQSLNGGNQFSFDALINNHTYTISGQTNCFLMKECVKCDEDPKEDLVEGIMDALINLNTPCNAPSYNVHEENFCYWKYQSLNGTINHLTNFYGVEPFTIPNYNHYVDSNLCECVDSIIAYIKSPAYIAHNSSFEPFTYAGDFDYVMSQISCSEASGIYNYYRNHCKEQYDEYICASTRLLNVLNEPLKVKVIPFEKFDRNGLCDCVEQYESAVDAIVNGLISFVSQEALNRYLLENLVCNQVSGCTPSNSGGVYPEMPTVEIINDCLELQNNLAITNGQNAYNAYRDGILTEYRNKYINYCLNTNESLLHTYEDKQAHYTLYYYDKAGNLIKTVPPAGVNRMDFNSTSDPINIQINNDRKNGVRTIFTSHTLQTRYEYNSLNQLIAQYTPDTDPLNSFDVTNVSGLHRDLNVSKVQMLNGSVGYLSGDVGNRGYLYSTTDGGKSWNRVDNLTGIDFRKILMVNSSRGLAVGHHGGILSTVDGGQTWDLLASLSSELHNEEWIDIVHLGNVVHVISSKGEVLKWDNINQIDNVNSFAISLPVSEQLQGIESYIGNYYVITNDTVAKQSFVYKWDGATPALDNVIGYQLNQLSVVDFPVSTVAYAADQRGRIFQSIDLAQNFWKPIVSDLNVPVNAMKFFNEQEGIALVTDSGLEKLKRTRNGGKTWTDITSPIFSNLQISSNRDVIIASGDNGKLALILPYISGNDQVLSINVNVANIGNLVDAWVNKLGNGQYDLYISTHDKVYYANYSGSNSLIFYPIITSSGSDIKQVVAKKITSDSQIIVVLAQDGSIKKYHMQSPTNVTTIPLPGTFKLMTYADSELVLVSNDGMSVSSTEWNPQQNTVTTLAAVNESIDAMSVKGVALVAINEDGRFLSSDLNASVMSFSDHNMALSNLNTIYSDETGIYIGGEQGLILNYDQNLDYFKMYLTDFNERVNGITSDNGKIYIVGSNGLAKVSIYENNSFSPFLNLETTANLPVSSIANGRSLNAVHITSNGRFYAVGENGLVLYSPQINGDNSFKLSVLNSSNTDYHSITSKPGSTNIYIVGDKNSIYEFVGPMSVRKKELFVPPIIDFNFYAVGKGTILSKYLPGKLLVARSTGNGDKWYPLKSASGIDQQTVHKKVWHLANDRALLFGKYQTVLATSTTSSIITGLTSDDIHVATKGRNANELYVVDENKLRRWNLQNLTTQLVNNDLGYSNAIKDVHVFSNGDYIAVGDNGLYFHNKADNVPLVYPITELAGINLRSISFHDNLNGVIVGNDGRYFKTTSNSVSEYGYLDETTWTVRNPSLGGHYTALAFASPTQLVVGGSQGAASIYDAGERYSNRFYYDRLGRLIVSRNERQRSEDKYSYTLYDELGRVVEAGEKKENTSGLTFRAIFGTNVSGYYNPSTIDDLKLRAWIDGDGGRYEVTRSYYDQVVLQDVPSYMNDHFTKTQKRIVHVTYEAEYDGDHDTYDHATHYKYDIHGNVKTLVQDNKKLASTNPALAQERFKRMDYVYDLVSGNVHRMSYQTGAADQWHHAYKYDADNRIVAVYTSTKTPIVESPFTNRLVNELDVLPNWQLDAQYYYYAHGPLARVEIGQNNLQGVDYYYTLQGWLKGVNSSTLDAENDPGRDGYATGLNQCFAKDIFGFGLHYYDGDYKSISGQQPFANVDELSHAAMNSHDLYNGNIRYMQTAITNPNTYEAMPMLTAYHYDQLNRLNESRSYEVGLSNNTWNPTSYTNSYFNAFTFDAMGNILTQKRHERDGGLLDDLTYRYQMSGSNENALLVRNRLYHVNDEVDSLYNEFDIDDMAAFYSEHDSINFKNNYSYDAEGRLIRDHQERIAQIKWRVDGKVSEIIREDNNCGKSNLKFEYNAMGQRIAKHVYDKDNPSLLKSSTYYILDAQGNQISMYEHKMEDQNATYYLKERNIYGSSRLGMNKDTVNMFNPEVLPSYGVTGNRNYELSNHLGNVLAVVSDNVYPISSDNSTIDTYRVGLDQVYDYSPFGVQLDGRTIEPDPVIITDTSYIVTEEWLYASDFNVSTSDLSSYNGWFATAGNAALFVDGSANQRLKIVSANTNSGANRYFDVINGERYVVKFDLDKGALSNVTARVYAIVGSSQTLLTSKTMTVSQTDSLVFDATSNQILVQFVQNGTFYVDNFSLLKKNYSLIQYDNLEAAVSQGSVNGWTYDASTTYAWVTGGRLNAKGGKIQKFFSSLLQGTNVTLNIDKGTNSSVIVKTFTYQQTIFGFNLVHTGTQTITTNGNYSFTCSILEIEPVGAQTYYIDNVSEPGGTETFTIPNITPPHIQNWQVKSQNHLLKQGEHTTNNVVTNRSIILNATVEKMFAVTPSSQYEFSMDDITTYTPPTSPGGPGGGISLFITYYDYTVRVYKGNSTTAFYTTQFNLSNATRAINFATDSTTSQIRIEISRGLATTLGYTKYVDNLKLRKFTGNTSVYSTNYSNMSLTANALDGWSPDNWSTTSATVDQAAGQYRLVAIGTGATAKVQREFTALPNQEHRFQYNLSLLNGGSTTVRVEQKVNGVYQYLATQQTQTTSGTYELSFVPNYEDIRISVSGTSRYALNNLYLDRDQIDTLVASYALSRGYRYGFNGMEKDDEAKGIGNSYDFGARLYDSRLGRWLSRDALEAQKPQFSSYQGLKNNPIVFVDPDGNDEFISIVIKQAGKPTIILRRDEPISNRVRAGAVENKGGAYSQTFYDYKSITTIELDDKGFIMNISKSLYTIKENPRFSRQTNSLGYALLLHKKGSTFTSIDDWIKEGKGRTQESGFTWVTDDGGVSPTRQRALKGAQVRDAEGLIDLVGGFPGGSLGNAKPDLVNTIAKYINDMLSLEEKNGGGTGVDNRNNEGNEEVYPGWKAKDTLILDVNKDSSKFRIGTSNPSGSGKTGLHEGTLNKKEVKERYPTVLKK